MWSESWLERLSGYLWVCARTKSALMCMRCMRGLISTVTPAALAKLDLDLALAPVEQNLFNECKSNLRLLEYGACGFPVICSDLVCYRGALPVTRVKNRFKDWVDAIRMHINDLDASASMGDELRRQVREGWMLEGANLDAWRASWLPN